MPKLDCSSNEAIKRQEIKESHDRLGPLNNGGHAFGLQRVNDPDHRRNQRERVSRVRVLTSEPRETKGPMNNAKKKKPGKNVDRKIGCVITPDLQTTHQIIEGEGEIHDWATRDPRFAGRKERHTEASQGWIRNDGTFIVEDEGS